METLVRTKGNVKIRMVAITVYVRKDCWEQTANLVSGFIIEYTDAIEKDKEILTTIRVLFSNLLLY